MNWRRTIAVGAHAVEERFDRFRFEAKRRLGMLDPFEILPYRGYGTPRELFLKGRVLEETGITRSGQYDTVWDNLRNMSRRFASDEVAGAPTKKASSTCGSSCRSRSRARRSGIRSGWSCSIRNLRTEDRCVRRGRCWCRAGRG